jgi:hypothetical protein
VDFYLSLALTTFWMIATMADRLGEEERRFWWQEHRNLKVTD